MIAKKCPLTLFYTRFQREKQGRTVGEDLLALEPGKQ